MSKGNTLEAQVLDWVFFGTTPPWDANGSFYAALHEADPGEAGDQTTNETTYPGYARIAVTRDSAGFVRAGSVVSNVGQMQWPQCTAGGPHTMTHYSIGTASSGAGQILYKGALSAPMIFGINGFPIVPAGAQEVSED
jgi:hypothetical protein